MKSRSRWSRLGFLSGLLVAFLVVSPVLGQNAPEDEPGSDSGTQSITELAVTAGCPVPGQMNVSTGPLYHDAVPVYATPVDAVLAWSDFLAADGHAFSADTIKTAVARATIQSQSIEVELPDGVTVFVRQMDDGLYQMGGVVYCAA